jgi:hypothetical protein
MIGAAVLDGLANAFSAAAIVRPLSGSDFTSDWRNTPGAGQSMRKGMHGGSRLHELLKWLNTEEFMTEDCAIKVADQLKEFESWFNTMTELTRLMEKEEGKLARRHMANMLNELDDGIRNTVRAQYPHLIVD